MHETDELESRLEELDSAIITHNKIINNLIVQRCSLISQKLDLEMNETIECAIENDISPRRVMDLIISEVENRNRNRNLNTANAS